MSDIRRFGVTRRWSDAVVCNGIAWFVEVPDDTTQDARGQITQVLQQVETRLNTIGSDMTRLVQVLIYLPNWGDYPLLNEMWDSWIPEGHAPARACVQAQLASPALRIELVITAAVA